MHASNAGELEAAVAAEVTHWGRAWHFPKPGTVMIDLNVFCLSCPSSCRAAIELLCDDRSTEET